MVTRTAQELQSNGFLEESFMHSLTPWNLGDTARAIEILKLFTGN